MGQAANREAADAFAANVLPIVRQASGAMTPRAITAALNARGIHTARGGAWHNRQCATCWRGHRLVVARLLADEEL